MKKPAVLASPGPEPGMYVWLLRKEETRSLWLCFLLSALVHSVLFLVLAATRIFHPMAGEWGEINFVWLVSPSSGDSRTVSENVSSPRGGETAGAPHHAPPVETGSTSRAATEPNRSPTAEPPPAARVSVPAASSVKSSPVSEAPPVESEPEAEMLTPRFSKKVAADIRPLKDAPAFAVATSVHKEVPLSPPKAVARQEKPAPVAAREAEPPKRKTITASQPARASGTATVERPRQPSPGPTGSGADQKSVKTLPGRLAQGQGSSARLRPVTVAAATRPAERASESGPGPAAAPSPTAPAGTSSGRAPAPAVTGNRQDSGRTPAAPAGPPSLPAGAGGPATDTGKSTVAAKPGASPAEKPPALFHPPISGDLKLVITGEGDFRVAASFREFRKSRRSRPFTYREARSYRGVAVKTVRTREKVMEAVIESTEEGVYDLKVTPGNGSGSRMTLVLKVHEGGPGARTRNLGPRSPGGEPVIVRILMPEGIPWDDEGSFTGNMEDSDSVTKFNAETGLAWKEYK